jgi:tight adherence protein B
MMLAGLAAVLSAATAAALSLALASVAERAFAAYRARYLGRSARALGDMFLFVEARQLLAATVATVALLGGVGLLVAGPLAAAALGAAGLFAPPAVVRLLRAQRRARFEAQLPDALQQVASALRAGLTLPKALEEVARESAAPLGEELGLVVKEVKLGVDLDAALAAAVERLRSDDLDSVATAASIARQLGGNVAETLESVAAAMRERFRIEGRIRALTSQGKLQGQIVAALPLGVGLFLDWYRPDLVRPMFEHAFGYCLAGAIVLLQAIGFVLIRRISRIEV